MNFDMFQGYFRAFRLDEVKIIGKDVTLDGECLHVVGIGRKKECYNGGTVLYVLEQQPAWKNGSMDRGHQTKRESMLETEGADNSNKALCISQIKIGGHCFALQGGIMGGLVHADYAQAYLFFQQMVENGWRIPETSPFYRLDWECMCLAKLQLKEEDKMLPELSGEIEQLTIHRTSRNYILQIPVRLEQGKTAELKFSLEEGGEEIRCYINQIGMSEPLREQREHFEDAQYREQALQHVSKEEFEEMKKMALDAVERQFPAGMGCFTMEYECTRENLSPQFYAGEELDRVPEPLVSRVVGGSTGVASIFLIGGKPEQETGPHGLRNRCTLIQSAVPVGTKTMEAELFMVIETIPEKVYYLN